MRKGQPAKQETRFSIPQDKQHTHQGKVEGRWTDGTIVLYIGAKNWPTPIPLANKGRSWYFDTDAGCG
jgi:hypothetical protein